MYLPSAAKPEDNLMLRQIKHDRAAFGSIILPPEVVEQDQEPSRVPQLASPYSADTGYEQPTLMANAPVPFGGGHDQVGDRMVSLVRDISNPDATSIQPSDIETSGISALEAWIDNVVMPTTPSLSLEEDTFADEFKQRQKELQDLENLQNVHFVELKPAKEQLLESSPNFKDMPLDLQVHYRKIVDKYPGLSVEIAERLAKTNVQRSQDLAQLRRENEVEAKRGLGSTNCAKAQPADQRPPAIRPGRGSASNNDTRLNTRAFDYPQGRFQDATHEQRKHRSSAAKVMDFFRRRRK